MKKSDRIKNLEERVNSLERKTQQEVERAMAYVDTMFERITKAVEQRIITAHTYQVPPEGVERANAEVEAARELNAPTD